MVPTGKTNSFFSSTAHREENGSLTASWLPHAHFMFPGASSFQAPNYLTCSKQKSLFNVHQMKEFINTDIFGVWETQTSGCLFHCMLPICLFSCRTHSFAKPASLHSTRTEPRLVSQAPLLLKHPSSCSTPPSAPTPPEGRVMPSMSWAVINWSLMAPLSKEK